jgi:GNAT superfamily N-acetyltransferase
MPLKPLPSRRVEIGITLLGFLGLAFFLSYYGRVFPSAAIDLTLSRVEISQHAARYQREQGHDLTGYKYALAFEQDRWGSYYLQRTLGVPESNRLIRNQGLPIWYWHARWFRPLQKEEFSVYLRPDGQVVGFSHSVPEDAPGADISQEEGRALAEDFLTRDRGWSLANWEEVAASSEERPGGRIDHHFEWRRRDFDIGESELRLAVDVQGDQIDSYDYWLKTPETFERHFLEQRNRASFFNSLSYTIGFFGFGLAAFAAYLTAAWRGVIPWRAGLMPALAVAVVSLLAGLNELPLYRILYSTTEDYVLFWLQRVFYLAIGAGFSATFVLVLWAGGQRLSKRVWARRDKILPRQEDRWSTLARSGWRGLMLGGMMGGYLVLFYLVATRLLGSWTPLDIPNIGLFATPFPFLAPLEVGLLPAMDEELMYRLVGISAILAVTRRRWLALLIPGALWGFAHLSYVRDPFFLRGIELTIAGVFLLGLFFLRFDLTTTVVAHFTFNAGLTALPLLRSSETYFVISGLIVIAAMLAPVVPGAIRGVRRRLQGEDTARITAQITPVTERDLTGLSTLPVEDPDWTALLEDPTVALFCLKAAGEIIGVAVGRNPVEGVGEVSIVYVAPQWRRQYWGSALVDDLCAHLRKHGAQSVQTTVKTDDRIAVAFWASQGWEAHVKVFSHTFAPPRQRSWRELLQRAQRRKG